MNKGERDELRRIIKARFKVLRSDVKVREAELLADLEAAVTGRFAADDQRWSNVEFMVGQAVDEANRKANDIYREYFGADKWGTKADRQVVLQRPPSQPTADRQAMRYQGRLDTEAKVRAALLELERREVDLLTELATGALESADAKAFMSRIPTVGELVPASRLMTAIEGSDQ